MSIKTSTCYWLYCDDCDSVDYDDYVPHFDSRESAISYAKEYEWLIIADRVLCPMCAVRLDCVVTGHQWTDWSHEQQYGIPYLERYCEHCHDHESDPPKPALRLLLQRARELDETDGGAA